MSLALAVFCSSSLAAPPAPPAAEAATQQSASKVPRAVLISKVVGEVGEHIVTSREVRINDAIERAVSQALPNKSDKPESVDNPRADHPLKIESRAGPSPAKVMAGVLTGLEKSFPAVVGRVLDEWVVYLEAKSLSTQTDSRIDVPAAVKAVNEFWGGRADWVELEASPEEVREIVERKLVAAGFVRLKNDPSLVPVSDDEALAYYRKNRMRFGTLPFSSFKDNIKAFLMKSQMERRLAEWRDVLRRKYKVRNLIAG